MGFRTIHVSKRENPAISAGEIVEDRRKREILPAIRSAERRLRALALSRALQPDLDRTLARAMLRSPPCRAGVTAHQREARHRSNRGRRRGHAAFKALLCGLRLALADRAVVLGRALALQRVNFSRWGERRANSLARSARSIEYFLSNVRSPLSCCSRW